MAFFALIYKPDGAPIADSDVRAMHRGFKHHISAPIEHRISSSFIVLLSYDNAFETAPNIDKHGTLGFVAMLPNSLPISVSAQDAMAVNPNLYSLPTPFAAIAWNESSLRLFSDPTGGRAIFYSRQGSTIIAASEPRLVLAHPAVSAEPDMGIVAERLCFASRTNNQTIYRHIQLLSPGHMLDCNDTAAHSKPWHSFDTTVDTARSSQEWQEEIHSITHIVIHDLLSNISNDQLSLALSGGLDSSALAGLMVSINKDDRATAIMNRYPGLPCDESSFQNSVLAEANFHSKIFNHRPFEPEEDLIQPIERSRLPIHKVEPEGIAGYKWCAENGIRYRIGGGGGDELFAHFGESPLDFVSTRRFKEAGASICGPPSEWIHESREHCPAWLRRRWRSRRLPPQITPEFAQQVTLEDRIERPARYPGSYSLAQRRLQWCFYSGGYTIGRELFEFQSADCQLQFIAPFWEPRLWEFCLKMPEHMRHSPDDPRYLQRQAYYAVLPERIRQRRNKVHFDYRHALDLKHPWVTEVLKNTALERDGLLNGEVIRSMRNQLLAQLERDINHIPPLAGRIWAVIGLELWWQSQR